MKIGFCGTMSVGKTTLVNALSELPELKNYKFRTERSKYLMEMGIPLNTDSTVKGQSVFLAERASELMQNNIITDRTIIDVMAFAKCSKSMNYMEADDFCSFASNMLDEYDYIFYVSPEGVDIENNGVRETNAEYRKLIDQNIQLLIIKYRHKIKNLIEIKGSTEDRIKLLNSQVLCDIYNKNTLMKKSELKASIKEEIRELLEAESADEISAKADAQADLNKELEKTQDLMKEEDEDDEDVMDKKAIKGAKKGDSVSKLASKLQQTSAEMKKVVKKWKNAEGSEKQKLTDRLRELTKIKKELEGLL